MSTSIGTLCFLVLSGDFFEFFELEGCAGLSSENLTKLAFDFKEIFVFSFVKCEAI